MVFQFAFPGTDDKQHCIVVLDKKNSTKN